MGRRFLKIKYQDYTHLQGLVVAAEVLESEGPDEVKVLIGVGLVLLQLGVVHLEDQKDLVLEKHLGH